LQVKADIEGTILAHVNGGAIYLRAGDEVPEGVTIDSHFVEGKEAPSARGTKRRSKAASRPADSE
jgi:hypothetical protein